jgi:hypothetical protein
MGIKLTPEEIGNNLDLEKEKTYPCSDGSSVSTVNVDSVALAQLRKIAEWGRELCDNPEHTLIRGMRGHPEPRRICFQCWQDLIKEAE